MAQNHSYSAETVAQAFLNGIQDYAYLRMSELMLGQMKRVVISFCLALISDAKGNVMN